ncbi:hypothetical protein AS030_21085 [Fictibacillus enclensis]|uniref:Uncharacterized protein n=1 Tax=Fictibacillus enclensis TaxID=1017270 RepID=A0A0V8IYA3_9BACL|nr:hypothetical protein [Fictibacillus enclensis]KSU79749.1 hypothetical protein AS030_21085 [Fictibacillus enclensis]
MKEKLPDHFWFDETQNPWWRYIKVGIDIELCEWDESRKKFIKSKKYNLKRRMLQSDAEEADRWKYLDD